MVKRLIWVCLAILLACVLLALSACEVGNRPAPTATVLRVTVTNPTLLATSSPGPAVSDTPHSPVAEATLLPTPTFTPSPTPEPIWDVTTVVDPQDLSSYRSRLAISWTGVSETDALVAGSMELLVEFLQEPPAQHISIRGDYPQKRELGLTAGETLDLYLVDGELYTATVGGWAHIPLAGQALGDLTQFPLAAFNELLQGIQKASYEGDTILNDIEVEHYSFDETAFESVGPDASEIEDARGDVYIAAQDRYLVHLEMSVSGTNLEVPATEKGHVLQAGTMAVLIDLSSINQSFAIEIPGEAQDGHTLPFPTPARDLLADVPIPPGAEYVAVTPPGLINFRSPLSPEEVATFYRTQMPLSRWDEIEADVAAGLYHLRYAREGLLAAITVAPGSGTGGAVVWVSAMEK